MHDASHTSQITYHTSLVIIHAAQRVAPFLLKDKGPYVGEVGGGSRDVVGPVVNV